MKHYFVHPLDSTDSIISTEDHKFICKAQTTKKAKCGNHKSYIFQFLSIVILETFHRVGRDDPYSVDITYNCMNCLHMDHIHAIHYGLFTLFTKKY